MEKHIICMVVFFLIVLVVTAGITFHQYVSTKRQEEQLRTTRKELETSIESGREWEYHAEHDALTGLLNRKGYERVIEEVNLLRKPMGFLLVDIDYFKEINDDYGHEIGDKILVRAAKILKQHIRETDYAFRFGGDEFVVLLCNMDIDSVKFIAQRIHEMSEQMAVAEADIPMAYFSAGLYFSREGIDDECYRHADEALYHTKQNGRSGCTVMDSDQNILFEQHEEYQVQMPMPRNKLLNEIFTGIWRIEMPNDAAPRMYCDESMRDLVDISEQMTPEESYEQWFKHIDPEYVDTVLKAVGIILQTGHAEVCYPWHHPRYGTMKVRCGGTADKDFSNGTCIYGFHQNITDTTIVEKEEAQNHEIDAITDEMTMDGFLKKTDAIIHSASKEYTLLHFDIKGFKAINDQIGFERGNMVLKQMSEEIKQSLLQPLVITRGMADHFYCLIEKNNTNYAEIVRLCDLRIQMENITLTIDMQCGVYFITDLTIPVRYMCDKARMAENVVTKEESGMPYAIFTDKMQQEYLHRKEILDSLDVALENKEFHTYFQPVYCAKTEKMVSAEALVRWVKPGGQITPPNLFIPTLEENGQMSKIDMIVNSCVQEKLLNRFEEGKKMIPISVNLSRMDFYNEKVMEQLVTNVKNSKIPTNFLRFEITESAYAEIPEQSLKAINTIREYGAKILIDDFGKGYSSLGSLAEQKFDIVKLDMSFVRQIGKNKRAEAVITAAIEMAHLMEAAVIAEGVETEEQFQFLRDINCDYIQGFYFSKPLPQEEFDTLLDCE